MVVKFVFIVDDSAIRNYVQPKIVIVGDLHDIDLL